VGRIENDGVEISDASLGKEGSDIGFDHLDETVVFLRGSADGFNASLRGIDCDNMFGTSAYRLQGEGTTMGVAVEDNAAFTETTDKGVLFTLIEVESWLLCI
jgi:hypothetical protein